MKPDKANIGRHSRVIWPGQPEHGKVGQVTQAMQENYVVVVGCVAITLPPEQLRFVRSVQGWEDDT